MHCVVCKRTIKEDCDDYEYLKEENAGVHNRCKHCLKCPIVKEDCLTRERCPGWKELTRKFSERDQLDDYMYLFGFIEPKDFARCVAEGEISHQMAILIMRRLHRVYNIPDMMDRYLEELKKWSKMEVFY
jgi:hypothetical protein